MTIACPCGRTLRVAEDSRGGRVRCPTCQRVLIVPQAEGAADEGGVVPKDDAITTLPVKGREAKVGPSDWLLGFLVVAAASALLLVGAAVGVTPALRAMESGGESELDNLLMLGVAAMGAGSVLFGIGVLVRVEMMRRMFLPAGVLFALFSGAVAAVTNLAPMWCILVVFFAGMTFLMRTSAGESYTGGGVPPWAISGPIAGVAVILAIVVALNQKKAHEATRETREEQRKFDQALGMLRQEAIGCATDLAFVGNAILDIAPGTIDRGAAPGSATEQDRVGIEARKRASTLLPRLDATETEFLRLRPTAREGWEGGRALTLRIVRVVVARCIGSDNASAGPHRTPLKQALEHARSVHSITDTARASAEDLRYLTDAMAWAEKVLQKTQ